MKIEELLRDNIRSLKPYSSARDEFSGLPLTQLDANENPFDNGMNRYPDPYQRKLKDKIVELKGLNAENLVLGNGSDELIDLVIRAFCEPGRDNIIGLKPSYGMYRVCCDLNNVSYTEVAMDDLFNFKAEDVLNEVNENTKIIFLCSPNNPNGALLNRAEIIMVLQQFNGMVVIDEAYIDFSDTQSWSKDLNDYPQLIVLQTFSKLFGLASIRLGMAWCSPEMVGIFNKIKPPYNVNGLTQEAALYELSNMNDIENVKRYFTDQRGVLSEFLGNLSIVEKVFPSEANFVLARFKDANQTYDQLIEKGIVVRNRSNQFNCDNCLRISVGTEEENLKLMNALKDIES